MFRYTLSAVFSPPFPEVTGDQILQRARVSGPVRGPCGVPLGALRLPAPRRDVHLLRPPQVRLRPEGTAATPLSAFVESGYACKVLHCVRSWTPANNQPPRNASTVLDHTENSANQEGGSILICRGLYTGSYGAG